MLLWRALPERFVGQSRRPTIAKPLTDRAPSALLGTELPTRLFRQSDGKRVDELGSLSGTASDGRDQRS